MDNQNQALAEELRHRGDRLMADIPTLAGSELQAALVTLHWLSDLLLAIGLGDDAMRDELLRQGEAASRLLHPERPHLH